MRKSLSPAFVIVVIVFVAAVALLFMLRATKPPPQINPPRRMQERLRPMVDALRERGRERMRQRGIEPAGEGVSPAPGTPAPEREAGREEGVEVEQSEAE